MGSLRLYRTVETAELRDLRERKSFRTVPNSLEAKQYWLSRGDAERFRRLLEQRLGIAPTYVVEVVLREDDVARLHPSIVDGRPARTVQYDDLAWFNGSIEQLLLPEPPR